MVEPRGSRFLSPFTAQEMKSGWEAIIDVANGSDFREFVIIYHEAGDETFRLLDRKGDMLPQRDAHTDTYRPSARLLNFRSEPHGERLEIQAHLVGFADESQGYGSYTFGDPATTVPVPIWATRPSSAWSAGRRSCIRTTCMVDPSVGPDSLARASSIRRCRRAAR